MRFSAFLLMFGLLFFQHKATCQNDWSLRKDKNDIQVFTRKSARFKLDEIRVACNMPGSATQLVSVLWDVNDHTQWVYKTMESKLIKIISPSELYYYTQISCPWPFQNRDLAVDMNISQNKITKVITVEIKNMNGYMPEKLGIVRIKYSFVKWVITPINSKECKVDYTIQADPSGSLPIWLLNLLISKGPYESFMKLRERMVLPQYTQFKFPFIAE